MVPPRLLLGYEVSSSALGVRLCQQDQDATCFIPPGHLLAAVTRAPFGIGARKAKSLQARGLMPKECGAQPCAAGTAGTAGLAHSIRQLSRHCFEQ
jgi:hypothetical protein